TNGGIPRTAFPEHFTRLAVRLGLSLPRDEVASPPKELTLIRDPFGVKRDRAAEISVELTVQSDPPPAAVENGLRVFTEGSLITVTVRTSEDSHLRLFCR